MSERYGAHLQGIATPRLADLTNNAREPENPPLKGDDPLATACLGIAKIVNTSLITHPCTVLRRQCQVHQFARKQHLTPFTLVPVVVKMVGKDGLYTLWKGSVGSGVLWTLSRAAELVIADLFGLPRTIVPNGSSQKYWRHIYLEAAMFAATTPFIVSSFIETVRSSTGFSFDDARVLDIIYSGFDRLRQDLFGSVDTSRRIGIQYLLVPTVSYHVTHYIIKEKVFDMVHSMAKRYIGRKPTYERTRFHVIMPELIASMSSLAIADLICYPIETVLHRLYIQGTRTLIDNLDSGVSAISVTAKYTGFFDCLSQIINKESVWALYSGVGAIGLQLAFHYGVYYSIQALFDHANRIYNVQRLGAPSRSFNTSSPGTGLSGNGPSAQFAAASVRDPLADDLNLSLGMPAYPTFAQTAQSADMTVGPPWGAVPSAPVRTLPSSLPVTDPLYLQARGGDPLTF